MAVNKLISNMGKGLTAFWEEEGFTCVWQRNRTAAVNKLISKVVKVSAHSGKKKDSPVCSTETEQRLFIK